MRLYPARSPLPTLPSDDLHDPHRVTRRNFILGTAAAGLGLATYAGTHARHELEVTTPNLRIANLPPAFEGFRIAQLSDIHLEEFTEPWFLTRAIERINALAPDLVLLTGDFVSHGPRSIDFALRCAHVCAEHLTALKVPQVYAVLGNHDATVGPAAVIAALRTARIPTLVDQHVKIERGPDHIWLAGAKDPGILGCDLNAAIPAKSDAPVFFMAHEPDFADALRHHPRFPNVDVMLSGHTHGGQIRLPFVGPMILPAMGKHFPHGLYPIGHMQLYVNRGLGTVGIPFRLNCPPEITHFKLVRA
jgi:predicted MPP superfamily phosphohydrolase